MLLTKVSADDVLNSSRAAQQQLKLYEQALGLRIQMQKSLQLANHLPPVLKKEDGTYETVEVGPIDANVASSLRSLLLSVASLTNNQLPSIASAENDTEHLWQSIHQHQQNLHESKWRRVLDRMHEKTLIGAKAQSLKVFNQSFWTKVENLAADRERSMEKSRALVSDSQRIGLSALVSALELEASPENADDALLEATGLWRSSIEPLEEEEEAQRRVGRKVKRALRDSESYEDSTFYSLLLKDFIQNSTANSLEGADITALRQLKKRRQNVDRKASKGRKIRYVVHSKLENFMFPNAVAYASETGGSFDADRLFRSLFQ